MQIRIKGDYAAARRKAYMDQGAQLDAVMKMADALRAQGWEMPDEVHAWIDDCRRVKAEIPKPK